MQYSYADREVARAQGRLFENTTVARLPRGRTYTYIVDETGAMSFGDVRDGWEFGVKHAHLAAGRGVLSAGEVAISETGEITYNLSSGSYTRGMIQRGDTTEALLRQRMDRVFAGQTGTPPTYTNATILPEGRVPTPEDLAELCRNPAFRATNGVTFCR